MFAHFRPFQLTVGWRNREENGRNKRKRGKQGVIDVMWSRNERETQMEWSVTKDGWSETGKSAELRERRRAEGEEVSTHVKEASGISSENNNLEDDFRELNWEVEVILFLSSWFLQSFK